MNKAPFSADSTAKLNEAINKLEDYSLQQIKSAEESSVSKTIKLVRSILIRPFDTRPKKHKHQRIPPDKHEVMTAIEFINRNRLFIEKLKQGTPDEQELAEKYTKAINNYNENCDKRIQGCIRNKGRIANFFSKDKRKEPDLPRIAMLKRTSQRGYPENPACKVLQKLYSNSETKIPVSRQLSEMFQMKAIILLENSGIVSRQEARTFVKNSPIYTNLEKSGTMCTHTQALSIFPGLVIKGNSSLDPKTQLIDKLLPESFTLSLGELTQTSFPHPSQRAGWTLSSHLIPDAPQRTDLLGNAAKLFQQRNQSIASLQQRDLLKHAKNLFSLKKKAFEEHSQEMIEMHETLATAILKAAGADQDSFQTVGRFYNFLRTHAHPYDVINETSQAIREHFMTKPHQTLLDAIIKGKSTDLGKDVPELRYNAAKAILDQAVDSAQNDYHPSHHDVENLDERIKSAYIGCMGTLLGKASKSIFLQYLSEDLIFSPPTLSPFEKQVQNAAYLHLKDFLDELSMPLGADSTKNIEMMYQLLKKQLWTDIDVFNSKNTPTIPKELAHYFQQRYASLSSI